jgi:hypothetical protein
MAFLDLNIGAPMMRADVRIAAVAPKFGAQERKVVLLARTDPTSSLRRNWLTRVKSVLFAIEAPHMLADPKLEALRRYAILYRVHGETLDMAEIERARVAGYADALLERVRTLIDHGHGVRRPERSTLGVFALATAVAAIAAIAILTLTPVLNSPAMASVLTGVGIASAMPVLAGSSSATPSTSYR